MGAAASKPVRETPVRYVAKQLPRVDKTPVEQQFKKPSFTAHGINTRREDVNTEPLMYVETARDASGTTVTDHTAPRWYLNTMMEMADNRRVDRCIISGNLPLSWDRDKFEPYALVRNRIDDEDLDWVLAPEQRAKGVDALLDHTKLERGVLQDILDTVELPRVQYRNYKGKLHRAMTDANTHAAARKEQLEHARESEILRRIGYSDEEMAQDAQYMTQRTRGVRALDELGASQRARTRQTRATQASELDDMLEERQMELLERGEGHELMRDADLSRPEKLPITARYNATRSGTCKAMYTADITRDARMRERVSWWLTRSRRIPRSVDKVYGVPMYNDRLASNDEQMGQQMRDAVQMNYTLGQASGAKGFADPRQHFDQMLDSLRANKHESLRDSHVEVHEDGDVASNDIFRFPHTRSHPAKPTATSTATAAASSSPSASSSSSATAEEHASTASRGHRTMDDYLRELLQPPPPPLPASSHTADTSARDDASDEDSSDGNNTRR